ncbi:hypothetical protein [Pseudomonas putida]|uniref:hypothetical protein n=1 Tax=Pseudomonas putida TaxID=303 RepID=UPI00380B165D
MNTLKAYKFAPSVVVAATSPQQAIDVLNAHEDGSYGRLFAEAVPLLCNDFDLDQSQTDTSGAVAPTIRQRLADRSKASVIQDFDGGTWSLALAVEVERCMELKAFAVAHS